MYKRQDQGLTKIPHAVTDRQALFVGDILATGYWAAQISQISPEDTVLVLGAGPTGLCTLQCVLLENPRRVIVCERDPQRLAFVRAHYPQAVSYTHLDVYKRQGGECTLPQQVQTGKFPHIL